MNTDQVFLTDVERFLNASGMAPARFGKEALNDPNFIKGLRNGRSPSLRTVSKVMAFIDQKMTDATQ